MSFALLVEAKSFFALSAWVSKFIRMYLHVSAEIALVGAFFVASFDAALPFLPMCVQMSIEVGISYEASVALLALEVAVRLFILMRFQFTFKMKGFWALVALIVTIEVCVGVPNEGIWCIVLFAANIA